MALLVLIGLLGLGLAACGGQSGPDGGGERLPDRGVSPYERVLPQGDEGPTHVLLAPDGRNLGAPSALAQGSRVWLWAEDTGLSGEGGQIVAATSDDGGQSWGPLAPSLVPEAVPWGPAGLRWPAVAAHEGAYWMVFGEEGGQRLGLARADAPEGPWEAQELPALHAQEPWEAGGIASPSLVSAPEGLILFYEARAEADGPSSLARAALRGGAWARDGVVLPPGEGCLDAGGALERCWDADGVQSAEVRLATTATGRRLWRAMYLGGRDGIGFAGSWDGVTWSRYAFNPSFDPAGRQREPSNLRLGDDYLLFFESAEGTQRGIGLAILRADNPTERF